MSICSARVVEGARRLFDRVLEYATELVRAGRIGKIQTMRSVAPRGSDGPTCVVLTPGHYNSAYYEHSFLADSMGVELVEAADLLVDDD